MRALIALMLTSLLVACATSPDVRPREFMDEKTAATITISSEPVIFVGSSTGNRLASGAGFDQQVSRDYIELYGIDVNRVGEHKQYFAVQRWLAPESGQLVLEIAADGLRLELRPTDTDPRTLGISAPPAKSFSKSSQWWYFPTDTATLRKVAAAANLQAAVVVGDQRLAYELFSDGRAQLGELAAVLP